MKAKNWSLWVALLAASCLAAGCGGESSADNAAAAAQAANNAPAPFQMSRTTIHEHPADTQAQERSAAKPVMVDLDSKSMAGLLPNAGNGYFNSGIKTLISAEGPQRLVDHLRHFEQQTEDPGQRLAASRFIALIESLHHSDTAVSAAEFMESLQVLPPFNAVDAHGTLKTELKNAKLDPVDFLVDLAELFKLQDLPGRAIESRAAAPGEPAQEPGAALFHPIHVAETAQQEVQLVLQSALDLLDQAMRPALEWRTPSMRTPDIAQFKQLTILPPADGKHWFTFHTNEQVTLPVFDEKTQQVMRVTLRPKTMLMLTDDGYRVYARNPADSDWNKHIDDRIEPLHMADDGASMQSLTLEVLRAAPLR